MAWRYHSRYKVDKTRPAAKARCDRCGLEYQRSELVPDLQWAGTLLLDKKFLVCRRTCVDVPQQQLRTIILPPDPRPIYQPRPEDYTAENAGTLNANGTPGGGGGPIME